MQSLLVSSWTRVEQGDTECYACELVHIYRLHLRTFTTDVRVADWWNKQSTELSPVLSSAILHYRCEAIHPFANGNGRTGRLLALWELYPRKFDSHHIFLGDEYYWEDRPRYYNALQNVRSQGDLTGWMEYSAEGLRQTLEHGLDADPEFLGV